MEDGKILKFNLTGLLKIPTLDIRKIAEENPLLFVKDYFYSLSELIYNTTMITESLQNICELNANDNDFQNLEEIKSLFVNTGCYKHLSGIDEIINIGIRGSNKFASDIARNLLEDFYFLHSQIISAEKIPSSAAGQDNEELLSQETQVLSKAIKLLYHEEATRKLRILAVDDAPSIIKSVSSILSNEYKVHGLTDPAMVSGFLKQMTPELFLLDYQMPEISGFDLVPVIRSFDEHKETPIIFLTSMGTMDHVSAAYALGACDFIVKPFQDTVLREKVAKHIVKKKMF